MALTYDGKLWLNLQEQVEKNKDDIEKILYIDGVLSDYGIRIVGQVADANELYEGNLEPVKYLEAGGVYGDAFVVGTDPANYVYYIFTRAFEGETEPQWFNIGKLAIQGKDGERGPEGPDGPPGPASVWFSGVTTPANSSGTHIGDMYLNTITGGVYRFNGTAWVYEGNIRGPQGADGIGKDGANGKDGTVVTIGTDDHWFLDGEDTGVLARGTSAWAITLKKRLNDVSELSQYPPSEALRHTGFIIGEDLYVILEDEDGSLQWESVGQTGQTSKVTVNGVFQTSYEMNNKRSVTTAPFQVYTTNSAGVQTNLTYSQNPEGYTIAQRNMSGQITATDPTQNSHVATRGYVKDNFVSKDTTVSSLYGTNASGNPTMLSYSNTPGNGTIPQYNANGNIKSASPVADNDVVNKSYFTANNTKFTVTTNPNGSYNLILSKGI